MSTSAAPQPRRLRRSRARPITTLAAFVTLIVIGGGASVAIRVSNQELPPFRGAAPRFAAASIVFAVMTAAARLRAA